MSTHGYNSWMGGDGGGSGNPNGGGYHGGNTGPNIGQYNIPSGSLDYGGNAGPSNTAATAPTGADYQDWNYEDVLVGVLGLSTPQRSLVTQPEWIAINFNSDGGSGLYRIFAATWRSGVAGSWVAHKDIFVYVNPDLLSPDGPWDNYFNTPAQTIATAIGGNYGTLDIDPRTFATAADEVQGVQDFYSRTTITFNTLANQLAGDASAFKGQAGEAFYELVHNLWSAANSASSQLATPSPGYASLISGSGTALSTFLTSLWNAIVSWTNQMTYTPIGAIYQALINGNVITASADNTIFTMNNPGSTDSSYGDLTTAQAWQAIEAEAKNIWTAGVASNLDPNVRSALETLATNYMTTASSLVALTSPTLQQISPGNAQPGNPNLNFNMPNITFNFPPFPNIGGVNYNPNLGGINFPNIPGFNYTPPNIPGLNYAPPNVPGGGSFATSVGGNPPGLNTPGLNTPGFNAPGLNISGFNTPGLNTPGLSTLGFNTLGFNTPGFNTPGGQGSLTTLLGGGPNALPPGAEQNALQQALADNGATQSALRTALGMTPSAGPLNNAVQTALGDAGNLGNQLNNALASGNPAAIQQALADNGALQNELRSALALAPSTGPLHNALETALADSQRTGSQLQSALRAAPTSSSSPLGASLNTSLTGPPASSLGGLPGVGQTALQQALADNGKAQGALRTALSLTPPTGSLHSAVQTALGDAGNVTKAVDAALGSGNPATVQQALAQNAALEGALRTALARAPSTGPLHNALQTALGDAQQTGKQLQQSLNKSGIALEPPPGLLTGGPGVSGMSLGAFKLPAGQQRLTTTLGPGAGAGAGGIGGIGAAGAGGAAAPVSSGAFVPPGQQASFLSTGAAGPAGAAGAAVAGVPGAAVSGTSGGSAAGSGAVPFYPPMAGAGGMGGLGQQQQERERSTWLAEDEDVWGTEPDIGPSVLGRDFTADDDETDSYEEYAERSVRKPRQDPSRLRGR